MSKVISIGKVWFDRLKGTSEWVKGKLPDDANTTLKEGCGPGVMSVADALPIGRGPRLSSLVTITSPPPPLHPLHLDRVLTTSNRCHSYS